MNERRKFLRGVGLFGALAAGATAAKANVAPVVINNNYTTVTGDEFPTEELEKQIENKPVLMLQATYGTPKTPSSDPYNPYMIAGFGENYVEGTKKQVQVQIVPGPDGKLYVKENDTWRKL
jgi:hypothetical protein